MPNFCVVDQPPLLLFTAGQEFCSIFFYGLEARWDGSLKVNTLNYRQISYPAVGPDLDCRYNRDVFFLENTWISFPLRGQRAGYLRDRLYLVAIHSGMVVVAYYSNLGFN